MGKDIIKEPIGDKLHSSDKSSFRKYLNFFVGSSRFWNLLKYEIYTCLLSMIPGAMGLLLRKIYLPFLVRTCGSGCLWGQGVFLRWPGKINVGDRVAIDDHCLLDARANEGIRIGDDVLIARDTILSTKTGSITLGDRCTIGSQCQLSSASGIHIGSDVGIGGQCYIGGGLYHTEDTDIPMMQQGTYSRGPVVVHDDVWIGAGVRILDGVTVGKGAFIGAGAVISEDVPEYTKLIPYQKLMPLPRLPASEVASPGNHPTSSTSAIGSDVSGLRQKIVKCILQAIADINRQLSVEKKLDEKGRCIFDQTRRESTLDSLGLINFVVVCEQYLEEELGVPVDIAAELSRTNQLSALKSAESLADYILSLIEKGQYA